MQLSLSTIQPCFADVSQKWWNSSHFGASSLPDTGESMQRTIFYVSDGTGITAETIGHSLLTQFEGVDFRQVRIPFIDDDEKAEEAAKRIRAAGAEDGQRPIVVNTLVDAERTRILESGNGFMLDLFQTFIGQLETEIGVPRSHRVGQAHGLVDYNVYEARMAATNYALRHDDGANLNYADADLILVGVSRSGKTPTCLYLALQFGVRAANYPLTEEDLEQGSLPRSLRPHKNKLYGLTIVPERLQQIREERRPGSRYASLRQCKREVAEAEGLFRMNGISSLNTTSTSVEEIASKVMLSLGLEKHLF